MNPIAKNSLETAELKYGIFWGVGIGGDEKLPSPKSESCQNQISRTSARENGKAKNLEKTVGEYKRRRLYSHSRE